MLWTLPALAVVGVVGLNHVVEEAIPPPLLPPMEPLKGIGSLSAETCAGCHVDIAREWADSLHARAATDPLYVADLKHQGEPFYCDHCHAPLVEQRATVVDGLWIPWPDPVPRASANERHQPGLRAEGVTCVACHQRDGAMIGPHATDLAPHPVRVSGELRDPEFCEGCHVLDVELVGDLRRPIADTLNEWRGYRAAGGDKVCVDCHMPRVADRPIATGGPPRASHNHAMLGAFDADFVRSGIGVEAPILKEQEDGGYRGSLELVNLTGHRVPTAEPHRSVKVVLSWLGASGERIGGAESVIQRRVDLDTLTEEPDGDNTLAPRERRGLMLVLKGPPPGGATAVRMQVDFHLWEASDPIAVASGLRAEQLYHRLWERTLPLPSP